MKPRRRISFRLYEDMGGTASFTYGNMKRYAQLDICYFPGQDVLLSDIHCFHDGSTIIQHTVQLPFEYKRRTGNDVHKDIWRAVYEAYKKHCRAVPGQESEGTDE